MDGSAVSCTPRKFFFCSLLLIQNVTQVVLTRYSLLHHNEDTLEDITKIDVGHHPYLATVATVVDDSLKLFLCLCILFVRVEYSVTNLYYSFKDQIVHQPKLFIKLSFPALLYVIQDNLTLLALANIEPAEFQMLFQLKIIFTAVFSVLFLKRSLACSQWFSLFFLIFGVCVLTYNGSNTFVLLQDGRQFIGISAVLSASVTSAMAGTYFELYFKDDHQEEAQSMYEDDEDEKMISLANDSNVCKNYICSNNNNNNNDDDNKVAGSEVPNSLIMKNKSANNIIYNNDNSKIYGSQVDSEEDCSATTLGLEMNVINIDSDSSGGNTDSNESDCDCDCNSKNVDKGNETSNNNNNKKNSSCSSNRMGIMMSEMKRKSRKRETMNMWMSELSLAIWSIPFGVAGVLVKDLEVVKYHGIFTGFSPVVFLVIAITAIGGLFSLIVVMELDNIVKNLTNSLSFVPVTVLCFYFFHFHPQPTFFVGASIVLLAVSMYCHPIDCCCNPCALLLNDNWSRSSQQMRTNDTDFENQTVRSGIDYDFDIDSDYGDNLTVGNDGQYYGCDTNMNTNTNMYNPSSRGDDIGNGGGRFIEPGDSQECIFLKTPFRAINNNSSSSLNVNSASNNISNNSNDSNNDNNNSSSTTTIESNCNTSGGTSKNKNNCPGGYSNNDDNTIARPMNHTNFNNSNTIIHVENDNFLIDSTPTTCSSDDGNEQSYGNSQTSFKSLNMSE